MDFEFKFSAVIFTKTQTSVSLETTFSMSRLNPGQTLSSLARTFSKKDWKPIYVPDKEWLPLIVILHSGWYTFDSDSHHAVYPKRFFYPCKNSCVSKGNLFLIFIPCS